MTAAQSSQVRESINAADYVRNGWLLVPVERGCKGPRTKAWNLRANCISDPAVAANLDGNVGLALAYSGVCTLDVDDVERATPWLAERGIDLQSLERAQDAVMIRSGRPNRIKLLYALTKPLPTFKLANGALELRCATGDGKTAQDLLPGSIHPDTGKPYQWAYSDERVGHWSRPPSLPPELAQLWENLATGTNVAARVGVPPELGTYAPPSLIRNHQIVEGGRNSYLTREAGRLRRIGHAEPVLLAALTAMNLQNCSPPLPNGEVQTIARSVSRYTPAEDAALLRELDLRVGKSGVIADEENIRRILARDPTLAGIVRFDEFRSERILTRPIPGDVEHVVADRNTPRPWRDSDTVALQTYIQRRFMPRVARDKIEGVVDLHAREHCAFHPVRDYLQSLEWDGTPRLDTWLRDLMGAIQQPERYLSAVGSKFFIAAVARIFDPGCQVDSVMVLEGKQGSNKSSALRAIAGDEYFSDSLPADLSHKDARDHLRGKWIIELSELAQFKRGEIETIKAFISRRHEQYRPSYGRHEVSFPRQCVFAGTTNADEYLIDHTGNRRFWVIACSDIDLQSLERDRDQLWAEAVVRYRAGKQWHLTGELVELATAEANERIAHDPWTASVVEILGESTQISGGEVLARMALSDSEKHPRNASRVNQILRTLGWSRGRRDGIRGWLYVKPEVMKL